MIAGLILVLLAAFFQGTFLIPMALRRRWSWEQMWAMFCLLAMVVFNWAIALIVLPNPVVIYRSVPYGDLLIILLLGAAWGVGAILFGLGMARLGLALGYPIIMGVNATAGALAPMLWFGSETWTVERYVTIGLGTAISVAGIVVCSIASARKQRPKGQSDKRSALAPALAIGIAAGCLSCLPNIALVYGTSIIAAAKAHGASTDMSANAVWAAFFSVGGLVNVVYGRLQGKRDEGYRLPGSGVYDFGLSSAMALMWIGSLYFYGIGASHIGSLGPAIGWPILTSVSIGVGMLWGLLRGEWTGAPTSAKVWLLCGLLLILAAVITFAFGNTITPAPSH